VTPSRFNLNINASHNCPRCGLALQVFKSKRPGRNFDCNLVAVSKPVPFCLAKADSSPQCSNTAHKSFFHIWPRGVEPAPSTGLPARAASPPADAFVPLVPSKPKTHSIVSKTSTAGMVSTLQSTS
jgi:hypothetical protein